MLKLQLWKRVDSSTRGISTCELAAAHVHGGRARVSKGTCGPLKEVPVDTFETYQAYKRNISQDSDLSLAVFCWLSLYKTQSFSKFALLPCFSCFLFVWVYFSIHVASVIFWIMLLFQKTLQQKIKHHLPKAVVTVVCFTIIQQYAEGVLLPVPRNTLCSCKISLLDSYSTFTELFLPDNICNQRPFFFLIFFTYKPLFSSPFWPILNLWTNL